MKTNKPKSDKDLVTKIKNFKARVTIITPTYNRANYIGFAIESVLKQSYEDYKYIILDDGSTDDTKKVVQKLIQDKKNCFYLYHDNAGEAETVNRGWKLATGEYFLQVNSDDTIEPELVSEMIRVLDENPEYVVAYPDFYIINKDGDVIEDFKNVEWDLEDALSAFSCYPAAPGAFIRKSSFTHLDKIKDGKYKYINDIKMLWGMALTGDFIYVPKTLASWRSHNDAISTDRYKSIGEVLAWADEYFSQKKLPKAVKNAEVRCRASIDGHCIRLIEKSDIESVVVDFVKYLGKKNDDLSNTIQQLKTGDISLLTQNQELLQENYKLLNSTSWKITKPLRMSMGLLIRLKNIGRVDK